MPLSCFLSMVLPLYSLNLLAPRRYILVGLKALSFSAKHEVQALALQASKLLSKAFEAFEVLYEAPLKGFKAFKAPFKALSKPL